MSPLRRLGDHVELSPSSFQGPRRIPKAGENLIERILFPAESEANGWYIQHEPVQPLALDGQPDDIRELGEYEHTLLGKLLRPSFSVVCISGGMGSGKTSTINFLVRQLLRRVDCASCKQCGAEPDLGRMIAQIDFRQFPRDAEPEDLERALCDELDSRSMEMLSAEDETFTFWKWLKDLYARSWSREVQPVVARMRTRGSLLLNYGGPPTAQQVEERVKLRDSLRAEDHDWWLRYLVLRWRYLLLTRFGERRDCALIVLDNLDSLAPDAQRSILDKVLRTSHSAGPTFVMLMRPESLLRQGLADNTVDVVAHCVVTPFDVVLRRLGDFYNNPERFLTRDLGLSDEQRETYRRFLCRMYEQMKTDETFNRFISYAAGDSIRLALILAQGLCSVSLADMQNEDITSHFLVRACVTQGERQFRWNVKSVVSNPFDIHRVEDGRFLLKLRLLYLLYDQVDAAFELSKIRNSFDLLNYDPQSVRKAINELTRLECQLIRSDGRDLFERTWGDERQTLYLTQIGKGYLEHLVHDVDFLEEVVMDCRVDANRWLGRSFRDTMSGKLTALHQFLGDVLEAEVADMSGFSEQPGLDRYKSIFGDRLITLEIVRSANDQVHRIVAAAISRHPDRRDDLQRIVDSYESLVESAEKAFATIWG